MTFGPPKFAAHPVAWREQYAGRTRPGSLRIEHLRTLTAFLPVAGDPAGLRDVLQGSPVAWLPDAAELSDDRWRVTVHGAGLSRPVIARVGAPWSSNTTLWRAVIWEPTRETESPERALPLLPSFDGELGLSTVGSTASLALEGSYRPPGGQFGAALDGLALHRVARHTAERLLMDIATRLASQAVRSESN